MRLSLEEQRALFLLAWTAIRLELEGDAPPPLPEGFPQLEAIRGVFVTLRKEGELRGCIGHAVGCLPLAEGVRSLAVAAAMKDRRFSPVAREELPELELELSVLSPLETADPNALEIGRHGLMIRWGQQMGLLLPQVASERNWGPETFLKMTCRKAGLPDDAWQDPASELSWFSCEVYKEPEPS